MPKISSNHRGANVSINDYIQTTHTVSDCPGNSTNETDEYTLLLSARSLYREPSDLWTSRFLRRHTSPMKMYRSYLERHAKKSRISSYNNKEENHYAKKQNSDNIIDKVFEGLRIIV